jgi:Protein of unknown function (DUF2793)
MSEESAKLRLPYIAASQAQKHVTHNEALTLLDTLCQASVIDRDLTAPPLSPSEGDCYIVASGGTGAWIGWDNRISRFIDGEWRSYLAGAGSGEGWLVYVQDEDALYVFTGSAWQQLLISGVWDKGADVASAATVALGDGGFFHITGTTTITDIDFGAPKDGRWAWVVFDGALTLTHNATTLALPGGADITTAAGDRALLVQDAGDNVVCLAYVKASGKPVKANVASEITSTPSGDVAATNVDAAIAELANEKAPKASPTFTGLCILPAVLSGQAVNIADDAVADLGAIATSVRFMLVLMSGALGNIAFYRIGGGLGMQYKLGDSASVDVSTSNVTGITGTDGHATIAYVSGNVKIENRVGSTLTVSYVLLGGGAL